MDQILLGIIQSSHPDGLKKQLIGQVTNAADQPQTPQTITRILEISYDIILEDKNRVQTQYCKNVYKVWAKSNRSTFEKFFTPARASTLMGMSGIKAHNAIWLLHHSLVTLRSMGSTSLPPICHVVETNANNFARENRVYYVVHPFCKILLDFRDCIPKGEFTTNFCVNLVSTVSCISHPPGEDLRNYITNVSQIICGLLAHIWQNSPPPCMYACLEKIFQLISFVDEENLETAPSYALAAVVNLVPPKIMGNIVKNTVETTSIPDKNLSVAVSRMFDWLSWPGARNIDQWIICFLRGLAAAHKYTILIEVIEAKVEWVYDKLHFPVIRNGAFAVLNVMLLTFQHSPDAFHKIVEQVPKTVSILSKDGSKEGIQFCWKFVELIHSQINFYPGFPDLYEPVLDKLKTFPKPDPEKLKSMVEQHRLTKQQQCSNSVTSTSTDVLRRKSETGKTGLINLGNTCYMNSVIQALYMCDSFRRNVLTASLSSYQGLLLKLQQVYAFLSTSQRAAYAPHPFLVSSRPPWFTPGCQQDCSEFLRYLLDQMHEQQLAYLRKEQTNSTSDKEKTPPTPEKTNKFRLRSRDKSAKTAPRPMYQIDDDKLERTLVQRTFGGKLKTTYKCLKCKGESARTEDFTDLPLPFPEKGSTTQKKVKKQTEGQDKAQSQEAREVLPLEDLVGNCLKPEKLEGDNKYHCDKCKGLQDGERTMKIVESPDYLILTLLRFAYDAKRKARSKIFTDVRYPKTLYLPVNEEDCAPCETSGTLKRLKISKSPPQSPAPGPKGASNERLDVYGLCAVVVHSGISSDGGHYYCYARHSIPVNQPENTQPSNASIDDVDYLQDKWFLFNDNRVTYSGYSSFSNVTQKFSRDTAYVLLYKKISQEDLTSGTVDANETIMPAAVDPPLRQDLRALVEKDNKLYLQEQELQERSRALKKSSTNTTWYTNWKDNDEGGPPGSCGGGFGGLSGSRLVF